MSTCYLSRQKYTPKEIEKILEETGYHLSHSSKGIPTYANEDGYLHDFQIDYSLKTQRVGFCRYGENNVQDAVEAFDCVSEHEEEFFTLDS